MKEWILSLVKREFIEEPEIFYDAIGAEKRKQRLLRAFYSDYDEVEIFEKRIRQSLLRLRYREFSLCILIL